MTDFFTKTLSCISKFGSVVGVSTGSLYALGKWLTAYYDYKKNKNDNKTKLKIEKLRLQNKKSKSKKKKK